MVCLVRLAGDSGRTIRNTVHSWANPSTAAMTLEAEPRSQDTAAAVRRDSRLPSDLEL